MEFHAEFHRICRQIYEQLTPHPRPAENLADDLAGRGFAVARQIFPTDTAALLSSEYSRVIEEQNETANTKIDPDAALKARVFALIRDALEGGIANQLEAYFGSFFRIDHCEMMRSRAAPTTGLSYLWHRDFDPMSKIHVLIYLTDCGAESPATLLTTFDDTRRCAQNGYSFPPRSRRIADLNELSPGDPDPIVPVRPRLAAGDATVFAPSRILHRGDIPREQVRDLLILNILPSLNPWDREMDAFAPDRLFEGRSTLWYDPFSRNKPSIPGHNEVSAPLWAQMAYPFPLTAV